MNKQFCPKCGSKYRPGAKFCPNCGYRLTKDDAADKQSATSSAAQATPPASAPAKDTAAASFSSIPASSTSAAATAKSAATAHSAAATTAAQQPTGAANKSAGSAAPEHKQGRNPLKGHRWFWYLGLVLAVAIVVYAIVLIVTNNQDYANLLGQHSHGSLYQSDEFGAAISEDLTDTATAYFVFLGLGILWLVALFLPKRWPRQRKLLTYGGVIVVVALAGLVNLNTQHHYAMTSARLGERYTKHYLSGHIFRYNYLENQKNNDDNWDQFGHEAHSTDYSHVFLKFNDDGTLGVNVNPYWVDDDETSYTNSQNDDYRTVGSWSVSEDGRVNIEWDATDSGAYKYTTVRVKRKHHKHHHKYKYVHRWVSQYVDADGNPDTSLPRTLPGDSINGNVKFGDGCLRIDGVTLYRAIDGGETYDGE